MGASKLVYILDPRIVVFVFYVCLACFLICMP
jgi:hypothetical protein